ncbi:hypothetical protein ACLOJK_011848 [Asimina triloba]
MKGGEVGAIGEDGVHPCNGLRWSRDQAKGIGGNEEDRRGGRPEQRYAMTVVELEMAGVNENDPIETSLHKYVIMRNATTTSEMEPQESARSNNFLGHHWISSWEPNSVDSTEKWASTSNANEEVEQKTLMNEMGHDHHELGGHID